MQVYQKSEDFQHYLKTKASCKQRSFFFVFDHILNSTYEPLIFRHFIHHFLKPTNKYRLSFLKRFLSELNHPIQMGYGGFYSHLYKNIGADDAEILLEKMRLAFLEKQDL